MLTLKIDAGRPYFDKDPLARLPVQVDWSVWLTTEGTTASSSAWLAKRSDGTAGTLTATGATLTGGVASVIVAGGVAGEVYEVRNTLTCANGSTDSRSIRVRVKDR